MSATTTTQLQQTKRLVDTKLFGWLVENVSVWTLCYLRTKHIPEPQPVWAKPGEKELSAQDKAKRVLKNILLSYISSVAVEMGSVYTLKIVDLLFFQHVPFFVKARRSSNPWTWRAFGDWLAGNFHLQLLGGGIALGIIESFMPLSIAKEIDETKFEPVRFLRNLAVFRFVVDVVFYWAHRALHLSPWLYQNVHARHHQHFLVNLRTNMHFSGSDLFIESALPIGVAIMVLRFIMGVKLGRFELNLLQGYTAWHESGTHFGKPVNVISQYPPLSVLYHALWPGIDGNTIFGHAAHHRRRDSWFGINPWLDILLGSADFEVLEGVKPPVPAPAAFVNKP